MKPSQVTFLCMDLSIHLTPFISVLQCDLFLRVRKIFPSPLLFTLLLSSFLEIVWGQRRRKDFFCRKEDGIGCSFNLFIWIQTPVFPQRRLSRPSLEQLWLCLSRLPTYRGDSKEWKSREKFPSFSLQTNCLSSPFLSQIRLYALSPPFFFYYFAIPSLRQPQKSRSFGLKFR